MQESLFGVGVYSVLCTATFSQKPNRREQLCYFSVCFSEGVLALLVHRFGLHVGSILMGFGLQK